MSSLSKGRGEISHLVVSENLKDADVRNYVLHWARNPDEGSEFGRRSRLIRMLPDKWLLRLLMLMKYDGILLQREGRIVGHLFFQSRPDPIERRSRALHAFSVFTVPEMRGAGLWNYRSTAFLELARSRGVKRVRGTVGDNPAGNALLRKLEQYAARLAIRKRADLGKGWFEIRPRG